MAGHADTALQALLDEKIAPIVRDEVVAALAAKEDESPTALALEGAIGSAVAIRLATKFTTETGGAVPPPAPRREPVPDSSINIAYPLGAIPGIDRMDPHPEAEASSCQPFTVLQGGPQKMSSPYSPVRATPAGQTTAWCSAIGCGGS